MHLQPHFLTQLGEEFSDIATEPSYFSSDRQELGPTPEPTHILDIHYAAMECQKYSHSEVSWNIEVHVPLLSEALRVRGKRPFHHSINYTACHPARIDPEFLPRSTPAKMVDFCLYLDPAAISNTPGFPDDVAVKRINDLRSQLPNLMINHTTYDQLENRPIVLSIETKRLGEGLEKANLQICAWHSAQWACLARLAYMARGDRPGYWHDDEEDYTLLDDLPFLPGIIIQGHDWSFVATTREGGKMVSFSLSCRVLFAACPKGINYSY